MGAVTPPDLASFLYKNRIVYLGICLMLSVTELMLAEVLYLQYEDTEKPISTCTSTPLAPPRFGAQLTTRIHIF
jgi:ATP-dependent protease ClpP protease subunit